MSIVIVLLLVLTTASLGYQVRTLTSRGGLSIAGTWSNRIQSSDRGRLEKVESVTRLHAGIKKDEEEEFFESEVSV